MNRIIFKSSFGYNFEIIDNGEAITGIYISSKDEDLSKLNSLNQEVIIQLEEYFKRKRTTFTFRVNLNGTPFQEKVWEALRKIPYGEVRSYQDIANSINIVKGARAVGNACNKNPILIAIPCHRVINKNGALGGFGVGSEIKQKLLSIEKFGGINGKV